MKAIIICICTLTLAACTASRITLRQSPQDVAQIIPELPPLTGLDRVAVTPRPQGRYQVLIEHRSSEGGWAPFVAVSEMMVHPLSPYSSEVVIRSDRYSWLWTRRDHTRERALLEALQDWGESWEDSQP